MVKKVNRYNGRNAAQLGWSGALSKIRALTRVELLVVLAVIALVVAVMLPLNIASSRIQARSKWKAQQASCANNLKQMMVAVNTWAGDHNDALPMSVLTNDGDSAERLAGVNMFRVFQVMSNELVNPKLLLCPADDRDLASNFAALSNTNISYFANLGPFAGGPALGLMGDRNLMTNGVPALPGLVVIGTNTTLGWSLKMHNGRGNIGMADGSVVLEKSLGNTGTNVNRLAVP